MITINLINDCTYIIIPLNFLMMFNYFLLNFFFYENLLKNKKKVQKVSSSVINIFIHGFNNNSLISMFSFNVDFDLNLTASHERFIPT